MHIIKQEQLLSTEKNLHDLHHHLLLPPKNITGQYFAIKDLIKSISVFVWLVDEASFNKTRNPTMKKSNDDDDDGMMK